MRVLRVTCNILTISFETRTDSTPDPLIESALSFATEFMDPAGIFPLITLGD